MTLPEGRVLDVPAPVLGDATRPRMEEPLEARVVLRRVEEEVALPFDGEVLGFVERYGEERAGCLTLRADALVFDLDHPTGTEGTGEGGDLSSWSWPLLELRAVGASSSSVQFMPSGGPAVELRFPDESPRRWEESLKRAVDLAWREAGRGHVVEFQPRIVAEGWEA